MPLVMGPGAVVAAGDVNLTGPRTIKGTATGEDTTLRQMAALVGTAEGARNRYTALADRAAQIYAPAVHLLAFVTFAGWIFASGDMVMSLNIAISVLIITCPCALGLAVPAVMTAASGRMFRHGLLVKNGTALERLAEVDTVVFDKTGTLTQGHAKIDTAALSQDQMSVLMALCSASSHPVSRAILAALPKDVSPADLHDVREDAGLGVEGLWGDTVVRVGRGEWVGATRSPGFCIGRGEPITLNFTETLRDGAVDAIKTLKDKGYHVAVFTGDTSIAAQVLAQKLGVTDVRANMRPDEKLDAITDMTGAGRRVLMVGDGLNDTAALAAAHASMSPASALDASRAASDIVILGQSLAEIPGAVATGKSARARVIENFAIAAGYNMIAIPIAIMGFATPLAAAVAMSASSITVLLNALRLR
jgi:Cu2+-exporting ATPase